jgi:hypothetical protein
MPTSAVYQPTTVSFENQGGSLLAQTTTSSKLRTVFRKPWRQAVLLALGLMFLAVGIVVTATGFADYEDIIANEDFVTEQPINEERNDFILIFLGGFFAIFGLVLLGKYENNVTVKTRIINNFLYVYGRIVHQSGGLLASKLCRLSMLVWSKEEHCTTIAGTEWRWTNYGLESFNRSISVTYPICPSFRSSST